jgi:hypothetical protein
MMVRPRNRETAEPALPRDDDAGSLRHGQGPHRISSGRAIDRMGEGRPSFSRNDSLHGYAANGVIAERSGSSRRKSCPTHPGRPPGQRQVTLRSPRLIFPRFAKAPARSFHPARSNCIREARELRFSSVPFPFIRLTQEHLQ